MLKARRQKCRKCGLVKPLKDFVKDRRLKSGYTKICKQCKRDAARKVVYSDPVRAFAVNTLKNHKRRGCKIEITPEDIVKKAEFRKVCPICGRTIHWDPEMRKLDRMRSPSLDRINGEKVIRHDNYEIICVRCNMAMGDGNYEELLEWCKDVLVHYGYRVVDGGYD